MIWYTPVAVLMVWAFIRIRMENRPNEEYFKKPHVKPITLHEQPDPNHYCSITIPDDIPDNSPVYLIPHNLSYELFRPYGKITYRARNSELLLACTEGVSNAFVEKDDRYLELFCLEGKIFRTTDNVRYMLKDLSCKNKSTSTHRQTETLCAHGEGKIQEIGFQYKTGEFARLYSVCYNTSTRTTLYTDYMINGAAINYDIKKTGRRPPFEAHGMQHSTAIINNLYLGNRQKATFTFLFGSHNEYYNDTHIFLSRGHFTADADMVFAYEKRATYYYVNVAPQYQIINGGNWLRVEDKVRGLAAEYGADFETYTGPVDILKLPHPTLPNTEVEVCLDANIRICAPKYYFKVIKMRIKDIVFITSNNPFATEVDVFCTDVCRKYGVDHPKFKDYKYGYTFCCELSEFELHDPNLPGTAAASYGP